MTAMPESPLLVRFIQGTLIVENCDYARLPLAVRMLVKFDERIQAGRARACDYAALMLALRAAELAVEDQAAEFAPLALTLHGSFQPRPPGAKPVTGRSSPCRPAPAKPFWRCWRSTVCNGRRW